MIDRDEKNEEKKIISETSNLSELNEDRETSFERISAPKVKYILKIVPKEELELGSNLDFTCKKKLLKEIRQSLLSINVQERDEMKALVETLQSKVGEVSSEIFSIIIFHSVFFIEITLSYLLRLIIAEMVFQLFYFLSRVFLLSFFY